MTSASSLLQDFSHSQGLINLTDEPLDRGHIRRVKTSGLNFFVGYELPLSKKKFRKKHFATYLKHQP